MAVYPLLLDILKYTLAGIGVVFAAFYLFKPYLDRSENLQLIELKKAVSSQTLPLRLQAYERLVLLVERISPANMLVRLNSSAYMADELQSIIITEIRTEYQHNITQQIYVNEAAWLVVKRLKDDTMVMVSSAARGLQAGATGLDLGKTILNHLSQLENDPYEMAAKLIRQNIQELF
jgi:hypothetical protein